MEKNHLPDLLTDFSGKKIVTAQDWQSIRRPELLGALTVEEYGHIPNKNKIDVKIRIADSRSGKTIINDTVTRKTIEITAQKDGQTMYFPAYIFIPKKKKHPVPVFLCLCNRGIKDGDPSRAFLSPFIPVETITARGYACIIVHTHDIAPDFDEGFNLGFHKLMLKENAVRKPDYYGTLSAWSWGMSRIMDYIETDPDLDKTRVATVGHSRGGKTSLWTCAQDTRFAMAISSCAGTSGDAITRGKIGEHIVDIVTRFPYWFCENYKKYANNENALPFDQHALLAMIAPRPLYISSRSRDDWADPASQFNSCQEAGKIYMLLSKPGLEIKTFPPVNTPFIKGSIGFHCKTGDHDMDDYDWEQYLNFADRHFK